MHDPGINACMIHNCAGGAEGSQGVPSCTKVTRLTGMTENVSVFDDGIDSAARVWENKLCRKRKCVVNTF